MQKTQDFNRHHLCGFFERLMGIVWEGASKPAEKNSDAQFH